MQIPWPGEARWRVMSRSVIILLILGLLCSVAAGCTPVSQEQSGHDPQMVAPTVPLPETDPTTEMALRVTRTPKPTRTRTPSPTLTRTPSPLPTQTPLPSATPTALPPLVAIDPGHGGRDLGARHFDAQGHMDFTESEVNLKLALRLRDLLVARGCRVLLTRDDDTLLNPKREDVNGDGQVDHVDECQARVDMINAAKADLLLSIHQNAFYLDTGEPAEEVGGTVTFYCADRPFSERNLRFAELIQSALIEAFRSLGHEARDRGVEEDLVLKVPDEPGSYLILLGPKTERIVRPCQVPGALSETLFLTHRREAELARDPVALDRLALAYADAISAYFAEAKPLTEAPTDGRNAP